MNSYRGKEGLEADVRYMVDLLKEFAAARQVEVVYFN